MILIYTPKATKRLEYILKFIFCDILRIDFQISTDKDSFGKSNLPKVNYSAEEISDSFWIEPVDLLFESSILQKKIEINTWNDHKIFFQTSEKSDIPFDLFAASFYMISRYEEYLPFSADQHGRFEANQSLAFKNGFLYDPIVDQWVFTFAHMLKSKFYGFILPERKFTFIPTIDIDNAYAYLYKGAVRTIGAAMRDLFRLDANENIKRFQTLAGEKDPFDTYSYIDSLHAQYGISPIWFFLVGKHSEYDKNIPIENEGFQELIHEISKRAEVAIHPSYESNQSFEQLKSEYNYLSKIIGKPVTKSRQHFLKLLFNETYQNIIKLGIKEDYTLGYASDIGFRAGTCTPFLFYDLYNEHETELRIYPFEVMDVTLNQYLKLSVKDAEEKIKCIIDKIKAVNGTFICLWHNESLSDHGYWKGWEPVYKKMLEIIFEK